MYPQIHIGNQSVPTFSICAAVGILVFVLSVIFKIRKDPDLPDELFYMVPKLFIALGSGYLGAILFDALFKIPQNGGLKLSGIMFYGGVVTGLAVLIPMLVFFRKTKYSAIEWLDKITVPFILFHAIGRIGCFFAGCCYGAQTNGVFGIVFPDVPSAGVYHNGHKVLPTQLFEACALFALAVVLHFVKKHKFAAYSVAYPIIRFVLEFWRADNRGVYLGFLSPSQFISIIILVAVAVWFGVAIYLKNKQKTQISAPDGGENAA